MRYVVVRRVTVLLGVLFLLGAGVFAWIVRDEAPALPAPEPAAASTAAAPAADGAAIFERHCSQCHDADDLRQQMRGGGETTRKKWEAFLEEHAEASTDEDRAILEYLAGKAP